MDKLYYDRASKRFYVKELNTEKNGDILVVTDEQYVDVTDEIVTLIQEHVTKDGKQVLCFDTTTPQLPDTVYKEGKRWDYSGCPNEPSWKPSEEQIYSLGTVVKGYNECTVGSVGYHLKEMYEQLKKL